MTLAEILQPKLADWRPAGDGRHSWSEQFPAHGWTVHVAAIKTDSLGCLVWELTLTRTAIPPAGLTVRNWAESVAARVGGLSEPLRLLEADQAREETFLRSTTLTRKSECSLYFEVHLSGTSQAVLRRFQVANQPGAKREQVPFALTHELLAKVADDLTG